MEKINDKISYLREYYIDKEQLNEDEVLNLLKVTDENWLNRTYTTVRNRDEKLRSVISSIYEPREAAILLKLSPGSLSVIMNFAFNLYILDTILRYCKYVIIVIIAMIILLFVIDHRGGLIDKFVGIELILVAIVLALQKKRSLVDKKGLLATQKILT
ncbi:hypothetical protein [Chitinophaga varians]|uniref:hypothetical protein n=1 Tax=Chitinophaga varians TaxID=2202339 RepID=UPI00165F2503|nr:hypothetical protein [Chitinophaga varians]MBC9909136.1 hypothetical protein [Chitinophaga varians]